MEKVMILTTPQEIAEGLKIFLEQYAHNKPQPAFETERMTVSDGCKFADVSYTTLCKWINAGKVPVHGRGRTRFLLRTELTEALKNNS